MPMPCYRCGAANGSETTHECIRPQRKIIEPMIDQTEEEKAEITEKLNKVLKEKGWL